MRSNMHINKELMFYDHFTRKYNAVMQCGGINVVWRSHMWPHMFARKDASSVRTIARRLRRWSPSVALASTWRLGKFYDVQLHVRYTRGRGRLVNLRTAIWVIVIGALSSSYRFSWRYTHFDLIPPCRDLELTRSMSRALIRSPSWTV